MNPKLGTSLAGLSLALLAMAQVNTTTTANDHGYGPLGRIGGPYTMTEDPEAKTTGAAHDHGWEHGRIGGPYTQSQNATATHGFGPLGRVGGPYNNTQNVTATRGFGSDEPVGGPFTTITLAPIASGNDTSTSASVGATDFGCGIHELTSKDPVPMTPAAGPTLKFVSDISRAIDPAWNNGTETVVFSINPITPTGPQQTPIPGTSPIYTTLVPGTSRNWNGTEVEVSAPTGSLVTVTVQVTNSSPAQATHTPVRMPNGHGHGPEGTAPAQEANADKTTVVSVAAAVLAALVAYGI
ncbi:hypothetical protein VUR80DRAFT_9138 [Thermomyces stellatus]